MLSLAVRNTAKLVRAKSGSDNVRLGRFFTKKDTARLMGEMLELNPTKTAYTVLDPGAGTGILAAAAVERICKSCPDCKQIFLTCYENDPEFLPRLEDNLERIRKKARHDYDVKLFITVYNENYLTESAGHYTVTLDGAVEDKFDLIICNPPTELVDKDSEEAKTVGGVTQVKINTAYLFARLAGKHLEEGGQLVIVLPTLTASASALTAFRREMAEKLALAKIHLFIGKQKNEKRAVPLKKSIILSYRKTEEHAPIIISTSTEAAKSGSVTTLPELDYDFVVDKADGSLTLPKSVEDTKIVKYIGSFPETITSLGLKMSTGLVLDSRCEDFLFTDSIPGTVPLIRPNSIKNGTVQFPLPIRKQYLAPKNTSLVQKNKNMIMIKRVPSKSDERFINAAVYLAAQLPTYRDRKSVV